MISRNTADSKFTFFLLLIFVTAGVSWCEPSNRLWVSFSAPRQTQLTDDNFLMQIDPAGNVVRPPVRVWKAGTPRQFGAAALSFNGSSALNFWFVVSDISRFVLNKSTLRVIRLVHTRLKPFDFGAVTVTHRSRNDFMSFPISTSQGIRLAAYPLDRFGRRNGQRWFLSPPFSRLCEDNTTRCRGGVASNGRVAFWTDINPKRYKEGDLFIRPLGSLGKPIKDPVLIDRVISPTAIVGRFDDVDVSDALDGNQRFVVYAKTPAPFELPVSLKLQKIDASTGAKLGRSITLLKAMDFVGNVKIDPRGRFVLFTGGSLSYLALDATGHASGKPKVLVPTPQLGGIDLLPEF